LGNWDWILDLARIWFGNPFGLFFLEEVLFPLWGIHFSPKGRFLKNLSALGKE